MDDSDQLTDLIAQIATEKAALSKLSIIKETLQNEVVAKKEELEMAQGVKRKQQEKHTQPKKEQKTTQSTKTHCAGMPSNTFHCTNMASTITSTRQCLCG